MQTVGQGRISGKNRPERQGPQDGEDPFRKTFGDRNHRGSGAPLRPPIPSGGRRGEEGCLPDGEG